MVIKIKTINNKISPFQFATLGLMMGNALFVGFGIIITLTLSKQDAWITMLMATLIALIPIAVLIYIINYKPDKNILEKSRYIFGKYLGNIINFVIVCYITFMLIIVLWTTTYFCLTQYLTKVPYMFLATIFILTALYAANKGIETIARTSQLIFYISFIAIVTIIVSLSPHSQFIQIKPILANGITSLIPHAFIALSYAFPPLLTLTIIPKDNIVDNKKYHIYLIVGFLLSIIFMAIVFYTVVSVNTIPLATLFRYPAYFVQYKIDVAGFFQGVENFLSLHWVLNTFTMMMMGFYYINRYIKDTFSLKEGKKLNLITIVIGLVIAIGSSYIFKNSVVGVEFMKNKFPLYVSTSLFVLLIIICIVIFIKRRIIIKKNNGDI